MIIDSKEQDLLKITTEVMNKYHDEIHNYLNSQPAGSLTDADVVIMVMNIVHAVSTNIYYSLKQFLPSTSLDLDFIRAKTLNSLAESFDGIKNYKPKESIKSLTVEQVKEIQEKGFTVIEMEDGTHRKITQDQLLAKKEEADKMADHVKKEITKDANTPQIISTSGRPLRG